MPRIALILNGFGQLSLELSFMSVRCEMLLSVSGSFIWCMSTLREAIMWQHKCKKIWENTVIVKLLAFSQNVSIAELKEQLVQERDQRRVEREKSEADLKAAVQKVQSEAKEELKRLQDAALRRETEQQEVINKLQVRRILNLV